MKKVALVVASLALAACTDVAPTAPAALNSPAFSKNTAPGQTKLRCFSGTTDGSTYGGTCTMNGGVDATSAVLNTVSSNPNGAYAGIYVVNSSLSGMAISSIDQLSFAYAGSGAAGGSPRFSLAIDTNGDGHIERYTNGDGIYAFIDTSGCNTGDANNGTLNAITNDPCTISYNGASYVNWSAFKTAHPTSRLATDAASFIIADWPGGNFTISNIQIGQATRTR